MSDLEARLFEDDETKPAVRGPRLALAGGFLVGFSTALAAIIASDWATLNYLLIYWDGSQGWIGSPFEMKQTAKISLWDVDFSDGDKGTGRLWWSGWNETGVRDGNRAACLVGILLSVIFAAYYSGTAFGIPSSRRIEVALAAVLFVSSILAFAAFGSWYHAFSDDDFVSDFVTKGVDVKSVRNTTKVCGTGCVLQAFSAVIQFILALAALLVTKVWVIRRNALGASFHKLNDDDDDPDPKGYAIVCSCHVPFICICDCCNDPKQQQGNEPLDTPAYVVTEMPQSDTIRLTMAAGDDHPEVSSDLIPENNEGC